MELTEDAFRALARSSPWRWSTLHFFRRGGEEATVEAWVRRPGWLRVVAADGSEQVVTGLPYARSFVSTDPDFVAPVTRPPQDVAPALRDDGLVEVRPDEWAIDYDDPMYENFRWVAMLDPVELSDGVRLWGLREDELFGRPVWRSMMVAVDGYEPRCGCCPLLWGEISERDEAEAGGPVWGPGTAYPEAYDVALDVATGVVVSLRPVGGERAQDWFEVEIID